MTIGKGAGKRAIKARETRRKMLAAARDLFVEHGYGATALQDVATRAGVAVQTIYFTFGTKRALLKEVVDVAIAGDDEPVATMDRDWFRESLAAPTAAEQITLHVAATASILERVAAITKMLDAAAAADPELASQWPDGVDPRYVVQHKAAEALVAKPDARPGLTAEEAADVLFGLLGPELYLVFTAERGWPSQKWIAWVNRTLRAELVA